MMAKCLIDSCTIGFLSVFTLNFAYSNINPDVVRQTIAALLESTCAIEWENVSSFLGCTTFVSLDGNPNWPQFVPHA